MPYIKLEERYLPDINSTGVYLRHKKTGARIVLIKNDDPNKVFSIAFRTPPIDDTGLTHILEHSVLSGSKKFKVKDPFLELMKGSLNTFLNAMTFPDKTLYPVASINEKDFKNLMDIYCDSVFNPLIYERKEIFLQEGYHYEINDNLDKLSINGVVYNEMKGAFSSPDEMLSRISKKSLFPDTSYGFESGGDPDYIPNLSYEEFLDYHKKYYHPSNSYIMLAGDMDFKERLEFLDKEYLSKFESSKLDSSLKHQKTFKEEIVVNSFYPINDAEKLEFNDYISYNTLIPQDFTIKDIIALDTIMDILISNNDAILRKSLLDAGIGEEIYTTLSEGLDSFISIVAKGCNDDSIKFKEIFYKVINEVISKGFNKDDLRAELKFQEFKAREQKHGSTPRGVIFGINHLSSLLYDDNKPFDYLDINKYFKELKNDIETNYFESLLERLFINNNHKSLVVLKPSLTIDEENLKALELKLKKKHDSMTLHDKEVLREENNSLLKYQRTPDTSDIKGTIPKLSISDINPKSREYNIKKIRDNYLHSNYFTNDIIYTKLLFNLNHLTIEELKIARVIAILIGDISTKNKHYSDIERTSKLIGGGIYNSIAVFEDVKTFDVNTYFSYSFSCLEEDLNSNIDLILDETKNTSFKEKKHILEILKEELQALESSIIEAGNAYASLISGRIMSKKNHLMNELYGIPFKLFLTNLVKEISTNNEYYVKFDNLLEKLFNRNNIIIHSTTNLKTNKLIVSYDRLINGLNDKKYTKAIIEYPTSFDTTIIEIPSKVAYNALSCKLNHFKYEYMVIANIIKNSYLWNEIRVKGGAYGASIRLNQTGELTFSSYRDPNVKKTLEVYKNTPMFLDTLDITQEELNQYIIGSFQGVDDAPHASTLGSRSLESYLTNADYKYRNSNRKALLSVKVEDIARLREEISNAFSKISICSIGPKYFYKENLTSKNNENIE